MNNLFEILIAAEENSKLFSSAVESEKSSRVKVSSLRGGQRELTERG